MSKKGLQKEIARMIFRHHRGLKYAPSDMLEKKWDKLPNVKTPEMDKFFLTKAEYHRIAYGLITDLKLTKETNKNETIKQ